MMIESRMKGIDSIHGKSNKRKRYKLCRCMLRIHKKIRNLVDECHRKFARWLCENHHVVVLLPEFKTKDMIKRGGFRKIHSKTVSETNVDLVTFSFSPIFTSQIPRVSLVQGRHLH